VILLILLGVATNKTEIHSSLLVFQDKIQIDSLGLLSLTKL